MLSLKLVYSYDAFKSPMFIHMSDPAVQVPQRLLGPAPFPLDRLIAILGVLHQNRLLHRTTPADRLDGPPIFKCGVSYDVALALARDVGVPLNDLMWDPA